MHRAMFVAVRTERPFSGGVLVHGRFRPQVCQPSKEYCGATGGQWHADHARPRHYAGPTWCL